MKKNADFGQEYYDEKYFLADVTGGKEFRRPDGSLDHWG